MAVSHAHLVQFWGGACQKVCTRENTSNVKHGNLDVTFAMSPGIVNSYPS